MDSAATASVFKLKAVELKCLLEPYVPPNLRVAAALMEGMAPAWLCAQFNQHVASVYADEVRDRDEAFFMDIKNPLLADPTLVALKSTWSKLDEDEREDVWDLLDTMCSLSAQFPTSSA